MTMQIIETVLALVLLYLVLSLLASQLNEQRAAIFGTRTLITDDAVTEAFAGQTTRVNEFYAYAPVFSLSKRAGKPSAIPPELFAQAWLAVMNGKSPPRAQYKYPSEFVASLSALGVDSPKLKQLVDWLLAGNETDWDAFETRVARWYADICDRAQGWFKRATAFWLFLISCLLTLLLNVDTHFVFKNLMVNDAQRSALADVAELVNAAQKEQKASDASAAANRAPATPLTPTPAERSVIAGGQLDSAIVAIERVILDPAVIRSNANMDDVTGSCGNTPATPQDEEKQAESLLRASNADSWTQILTHVKGLIREASDDATIEFDSGDATRPADVKRLGDHAVDHWVRAGACIGIVQKWIGTVSAQKPVTAEARKSLETARDLLAKVQVYIGEERRGATLATSLRARFELDPNSMIDCAMDFPSDRIGFRECLRRTTPTGLPLGWPAPFGQLCKARTAAANDKVSDAYTFCPDLPANPTLDLPALVSETSVARWVSVGIGWLLTALLVSLGAPFWFGVLGKVTDLRMAGRVRGLASGGSEGDNTAAGGTGPLPKAGGGKGSTSAGTYKSADGASGSTPSFEDARNVFEQTLRRQDISRLQKALGAPPNGRLDQTTRNRIREALGNGEEELTATTFEELAGRKAPVAVDANRPAAMPVLATPATNAAANAMGSSGGPWERGADGGDQIRELIVALNRIFPERDHWPALPSGTVFTDDVRARVVLYRAMVDQAPWRDRRVCQLAKSAPAELRRLDNTLRQAIVADRTHVFEPPAAAPWMFYAIGELGIVELPGAAEDDPRVLDYLTTMGAATSGGDETAWCGAFAGWVLSRQGVLERNFPGVVPSSLLLAASWRSQRPRVNAGAAAQGDLFVVPRGGGRFHVAFVLEMGAEGRATVIGGNQGSDVPGAVTVVRFRDEGEYYRLNV